MTPLTDEELALYEDARTMANIAAWGVELQVKRLKGQRNEISEFVLQPVIDFHFLVSALTRLRQAAHLTSTVVDITHAIDQFDRAIPDLRTIRNILEHIDEYRTGQGKNKHVKRDSFQTVLFDNDHVSWVDYTINYANALKASHELFVTVNKALPSK